MKKIKKQKKTRENKKKHKTAISGDSSGRGLMKKKKLEKNKKKEQQKKKEDSWLDPPIHQDLWIFFWRWFLGFFHFLHEARPQKVTRYYLFVFFCFLEVFLHPVCLYVLPFSFRCTQYSRFSFPRSVLILSVVKVE